MHALIHFLLQIKQEATPLVTKRSILQALSKQYDPLGWLSPITVRAKLLIQDSKWVGMMHWMRNSTVGGAL